MNYCSATSSCSNPKISKIGDEFFCLNCFELIIKDKKDEKDENVTPERVNIYQCCETPDIHFGDLNDVCMNCGSIYEKMLNELSYMENDEYQTNVLTKIKKVHVPYQYLRMNYPEIKYTEIYDFIQNSIDFIKTHCKLSRRPYAKYVPFLYNFYRLNKKNIPEIKHFNKDKDLIVDKDILAKLYELLNIKANDKQISNIKSSNITKKPTSNEEDLAKYYYFNESKNQYFKKKRYCQFNKCYKIGNFQKGNIKYCKEHSNNGVNINDKSTVTKCKYKDCKKTTKTDYCANHKHKCIDNECDIRIMKIDSYCKIHK